jgi:hypothetical protein
MSFNGSGTFLINTAGQPVVTNTVISQTAFNALTADLGTGLSTTITKDGQTTATAKIPFAQGLSAAAASNFAAGTVAAPGLYLSTDTGTGLYRIAANNYGVAVSGAKVLDIASTGLGVTGTLSTTSTAVIGSGANGQLQLNNAGGNNGATLWFSGASVASGNKNWVIDSGNFAGSVLSFAIANSAGGVINSAATEVGRFSSTGLAITGTLSATGQVTSNGSTNDVAFIAQDSGSVTGFKANNTGAGGRNYSMFSTANASGLGGGLFAIYDSTAGAARLTINSGGTLTVGGGAAGTTGPFTINSAVSDWPSWINSSGATPYGLYITYTAAAPNNSGSYFLFGVDTSATRFNIRSNGGLANYSANDVNLSDQREKKDIQLAGSYLEKICAIPVKTFLFNDQTDSDLNLGVIAQDVQAVAPELVSESDWGTKDEPKMRLSIYQTDFQYALMKSVQELAIKVSALEAK